MTPHERAEKLCQEAERLGLDGPTEGMIADAISSAEHETYQEISKNFRAIGYPSMSQSVDNWLQRKYDTNE